MAVNEKRGNQNESRLPPLTVAAVDVLAIMYLLIKIEFNLNILAVRIRISNYVNCNSISRHIFA